MTALRRLPAAAPSVGLPAERRRLLLLLAATLGLFAPLAVWARLASPAPWEAGVLLAIALQPGPIGDLFGAINTLGNLPVWAALVAVAAVGAGVVRGLWAALLVGLSVASDLVAFGVKVLVERQRPESVAVQELFGTESFAFPSGHVVRAVALCAVLAWVFAPPGWRFRTTLAAGIAAGAVMGYARVALGVHWPTDALGGLLLGLAWLSVTALALEWRHR